MKKYIIGVLFIGMLCSTFALAQDEPTFQKVTNLIGLSADVDISYPRIGINNIDRSVRNYIIREITQFKKQSVLNLGSTGNEQNILHIDCRVVTNTIHYYSILCDQYVYVQGARGQFIKSFSFNKQTRSSMELSDLFPDYRLLFLSQNLRHYFINKLQATTPESQDWIKKGITANYADFSSFTLIDQGSGIQSLQIYFNPFKISGPEQGIQWVKLSYPSLKIAR